MPYLIKLANKVKCMRIVEAEISDLEYFFEYLERQLTENGVNNAPIFQPISRNQTAISKQTSDKFRNGFTSNLGSLNWRKLWLAKDSSGNIMGHIDLRHHSSEHSFHRVLLGMGVESSCRQQGVGEKLVKTVLAFCIENSSIDWLDLNVLSVNVPAKSLYQKCGFKVIGEMTDFYRIDGSSISEITMTKSTKKYA